VSAPAGTPSGAGFKAVTALFLPRTRNTRLAFLAIIALSIASFSIIPHWLRLVFFVPGLIALSLLALIIGIKFARYTDIGTDSGWSALFKFVVYVIVMSAVWIVPVGGAFLVSLVSSGETFSAAYHQSYSGTVGLAEADLALAVAWLLLGVPNQAFKISLDNDGKGDAQRVLVALITATSCVLTAIYLFLMHSNGWPLHQLHRGALVVGIVVTVVLVAPLYRSLAKACWRRGLGGIIDYEALRQYWGNTASEARKALGRFAESEASHETEENSDEKKSDEDTVVPTAATPLNKD